MAMFPKAVTFLGSDSNSKSARLNDKKLLENFQGIDFLFFFEDGNYREIGLDHKAWPDKMSYTCRSQVKKGDSQTLLDEQVLQRSFHYQRR